MINVAVSGAMGRLGRAISSGVAAAQDMRLTGLYAPGHEGKSFANLSVSGKPDELSAHEIIEGARGGLATGVRIHSLRMTGLLSDQEVAFSNDGETFSLVHRSTSYESFVEGALLAIQHVEKMKGVSIGLDTLLGIRWEY